MNRIYTNMSNALYVVRSQSRSLTNVVSKRQYGMQKSSNSLHGVQIWFDRFNSAYSDQTMPSLDAF